MRTIDKYIFLQLVKPFLLFSFTFIGILWLVQILPKLENLVFNEQPFFIFFQVGLNTIPQVAYFVIPIAAFFSTIYAINKLFAEAEIVAIIGAGFSYSSIAKIVFLFGTTVSIFLLILVFFILPKSAYKLQSIFFQIEQNYSARLVNVGKFFHPVSGITIYVRDSFEDNQMKGIFVFDDRNEAYSLLYSAREATIREDNGVKDLIMKEGVLQISSFDEKSVVSIRFDRFGFNLNTFLPKAQTYVASPLEVSPYTGIFKSKELANLTNYTETEYVAESHMKLASILSPISLSMLAMISLVLLGYEKNNNNFIIVSSSLVALFMQVSIIGLKSLLVQSPNLVFLIYMPPVVVLLSVFLIIKWYENSKIKLKVKSISSFGLDDEKL